MLFDTKTYVSIPIKYKLKKLYMSKVTFWIEKYTNRPTSFRLPASSRKEPKLVCMYVTFHEYSIFWLLGKLLPYIVSLMF